MSQFVKVKYVAGVGIDRPVPLPVSGLRTVIGHKVMLLHKTDANELLIGADYELCDDDAAVDIDYTKPEEAQVVLDGFVDNMQNVALATDQAIVEAKEERKESQRDAAMAREQKKNIVETPVAPEKTA